MFKVGDKIKAIKNGPAYKAYGEIIMVVDKTCSTSLTNHVCYIEADGHHNGWNANYFKLVERKYRTEVDYLDCFKNNFKDGI